MSTCATCKHWNTHPLLGGNEKDLGSCGLTVNDTNAACSGRKNRKALAQNESGAYLCTHETFGCNQFKAKT